MVGGGVFSVYDLGIVIGFYGLIIDELFIGIVLN